MGVMLISFFAVSALLCVLPALVIHSVLARQDQRMRAWARTTATVVRVETASQYHSNSNGHGHYSTYLVGIYQYIDPRGGVHHGRTRIAGVNLAGGPERIHILVNPHNWNESMEFPRNHNRGCALGAAWTLAIFGILSLLLGVLVVAGYAAVR